jgi:hypothetical protein
MYINFKDKKSKRSHKAVGIKVFLLFCLVIEGSRSGSITLTDGSGSGRPKTCRSGGSGSATQRDHEHCDVKYHTVDGNSADVLPPPLYPVHLGLQGGIERELQVEHVDVCDAPQQEPAHRKLATNRFYVGFRNRIRIESVFFQPKQRQESKQQQGHS